jgi:hypothetical protein
LSRQWLILLDGAIGVALVSGETDAALDARTAAEALLDAESAGKSSESRETPIKTPSKRPPSRRTAT